MKINKAYKFRLYPNKEQETMFYKTTGCCRFIYNYFLDQSIKRYRKEKKFLFKYDMTYQLPELKKQYPFLKEVNSQSLVCVCINLDNAFKKFIKKQANFPKFKKKGIGEAFCNPQNCEVKEKKIKFPKIGWIKCKIHREIEGKIKSITINKNCDKWYASILTEQEIKEEPKTYNNPIGIDVGIREFAFLSNGENIPNPEYYRNFEDKLAIANRRLAKKKIGSKNFIKQKKKVQKIYSKIYNSRKDFLHKKSKDIVDRYDLIGVENLNINGIIKNKHLSKSIADSSWGTFINYLEYKSLWNNKTLQKVGRFYPSSQLCSECGSRKVMPLSQRTYVCEDCGAIIDRDYNASKNIEKEAIRLAFENLPLGKRNVKPVEKVGYEICEAGIL